VQHTGFQLWLDVMAGDDKAWRTMRKYQIQDVKLLVELYEKLRPWADGQLPNAALTNGKPDSCVACGGQRLTIRGRSYTAAGSYPRYRCSDCGKWQRSKSAEGTSNFRSI
jgi:predicted SprT family Zn-dependent metalloprotease